MYLDSKHQGWMIHQGTRLGRQWAQEWEEKYQKKYFRAQALAPITSLNIARNRSKELILWIEKWLTRVHVLLIPASTDVERIDVAFLEDVKATLFRLLLRHSWVVSVNWGTSHEMDHNPTMYVPSKSILEVGKWYGWSSGFVEGNCTPCKNKTQCTPCTENFGIFIMD